MTGSKHALRIFAAKLAQGLTFALALATAAPLPARAGDGGFCARLKVQAKAAKVGFATIRGEFRTGRTPSGLIVARTYSNVELWPDSPCFFSVDKDRIQHSCETGFDKDDAAARVLRDNLADDLKACFAREIKGKPVLSDAPLHSATLTLSGKRALQLTVVAQQAEGSDGRILISVLASE